MTANSSEIRRRSSLSIYIILVPHYHISASKRALYVRQYLPPILNHNISNERRRLYRIYLSNKKTASIQANEYKIKMMRIFVRLKCKRMEKDGEIYIGDELSEELRIYLRHTTKRPRKHWKPRKANCMN